MTAPGTTNTAEIDKTMKKYLKYWTIVVLFIVSMVPVCILFDTGNMWWLCALPITSLLDTAALVLFVELLLED